MALPHDPLTHIARHSFGALNRCDILGRSLKPELSNFRVSALQIFLNALIPIGIAARGVR
jgi:hypothetical protein